MSNKSEEIVRKKVLAANYENKMRKRKEEIKDCLSDEQYIFLTKNYADTSIYSDFVTTVKNLDTVPSEYLSNNMGWIFDLVIPSSQKDVVLYFSDRLQEYPCSNRFCRRSWRVKDNSAYLKILVSMIGEHYFNPNLIDEPLEKILNKDLPEQEQAFLDENSPRGCGYTEWQVAYALDHNDSKVEDAVSRILTEENGSGMMTKELVCGILISHRSDFYELLGKSLISERLKEGLRQVICENADCGTKSGFLTILKVIEDNNLIRFSSVKRAVGTWLGIMEEGSRNLECFSEKSVRLIIDCLENENVREKCLTSKDAMQILIALWSYGFDDIDNAMEKIADISNNGSTHQLLVSGYFATNLDISNKANQIAKIVLKKHYDKYDVLAVWIPCFMPARIFVLWNAIKQGQPLEYRFWFESLEEVQEYYQLIKKIFDTFTEKTQTFSPCVFPWNEAKISKNDFAEILCALAALSGNYGMIDETCHLIKECGSGQRHIYFSAMLREPKTALQRKTALEGLVDRETETRKSAYDIVSKLKLSEDEYRYIENFLRFKGADIRKNVMELLLKQSNLELTLCIGRLLENKKEEVRLGGLDMLLQLKKDAKRNEIADSFKTVLLERANTEDISPKEKILLDSLVTSGTETKMEKTALFSEKDKYLPTVFDSEYIELCANTFEEYFPNSKLPDMIRGKKGGLNIFGKIKSTLTDHVFFKTSVVAAMDLISLSKWIDDHKTDSFINYDGKTVLLGTVQNYYKFIDKDGKIPLPELWNQWLKANNITSQRLVRALVLFHAYKQKTPYSEKCVELIRTVFGKGFEEGRELTYSAIIYKVLNYMLSCLPREEPIQLASALAIWFLKCVPDDMVMIYSPSQKKVPPKIEVAHLLAHEQLGLVYGWLDCKNSDNLKNTFPLAVASAERCLSAFKKMQKEANANYDFFYPSNDSSRFLHVPYEGLNIEPTPLVGVNEYLFAAYKGIISEAQLFEFLLDSDNIRESLEIVTAVATVYYEKGNEVYHQDSYKAIRYAQKVKEFLGKDEEPNEEDIKIIEYVSHIYEKIIPFACG